MNVYVSPIPYINLISESLFGPESSGSTEGMMTDDERTMSPDRESAVKLAQARYVCQEGGGGYAKPIVWTSAIIC